MPTCEVCGRQKRARVYPGADVSRPEWTFQDPAPLDKDFAARNSRNQEGRWLKCERSTPQEAQQFRNESGDVVMKFIPLPTMCATPVFLCFSCIDLLGADEEPRCPTHLACATPFCQSKPGFINFCSTCRVMYRSCGSRQHGVGNCQRCGARTKGPQDALEAFAAHETPLSVPIPPPMFVPCVMSSSGGTLDFTAAAMKYLGSLADWVQSNAPKHDVDAGHLTFCVTLLEKNEEQDDPKLKVLFTHSAPVTYEGVYAKKASVRAKLDAEVKEDRFALAGLLAGGMRRLARAFMEENRKYVGEFLAQYKRANPGNSMMLPESDPMIFLDRDTGTHFLLEETGTNQDSAAVQWKRAETASVRNDALLRALNFAHGHGFRLMTGEDGALGSYVLEENNLHHAEMRAVRYASRFKYSIVAMAPTKGCCASAQRKNNCHGTLSALNLIERIPIERRTQDGFNAFLKS